MKKERRAAPRVKVNLPARWEGVISRNPATITDLSRNGCFVLTGGKVEVKELVSLEIDFPGPCTIHFWAEVVDEASEIGFAVRFNSCSDEDAVRLDGYLKGLFSEEARKKTK